MIWTGILMLALAASSTKELPPSGILYDSKGLGRIQYTCYFLDAEDSIALAPTNKITCRFDQLMLMMKSPKEMEQKLTERRTT